MLWNCRKPLVEHELEDVVISLDDEGTPPKIRAPMADRLDEADELALVRSRFEVPSRKGPTKERDGVPILMKDSSEAGAGRVAVDDECGVEVREMEHWRRTQRGFEGHKCRVGGL